MSPMPRALDTSTQTGVDIAAQEEPPSPVNELRDRGVPIEVLQAFKKECTSIATEYFCAGDIAEAQLALAELVQRNSAHAQQLLPHFVKRLIVLALDRKDAEKEQAATLLNALRGEGLEVDQYCRCFTYLLEDLEELMLDVPDADASLAIFLARAHLDGVLTGDFIKNVRDRNDSRDKAREVAKTSLSILRSRNGPERVLLAWGGANYRTVDRVKKQMDSLLREVVTSRDFGECAHGLSQLEVPFFHHEFVKRALSMAMERSETSVTIMDMLQELGSSALINVTQMAKGFQRMVERLPDFSLDVPDAYQQLSLLTADARARELLPASQSSWAMLRSTSMKGGRLVGMRLGSAEDLTLLEHEEESLGGASAGGLSAIRSNVAAWNLSAAAKSHERPRGGWSGLRHKPKDKGAAPAFCSTPNMAFLNTSNLVKLECQTRNYKPFYDEYRIGDTIGTGGFAVVREAVHRATGEVFAVKIMKVAEEGEEHSFQTLQEIHNEIKLMQMIQHKNVVRTKEYFHENCHVYIIMHYLRGPELMDALLDLGHGYSESDVRTIMKCLVDAIAYMHANNCIHRDLKLENLVLAEPGDLSSVTIVDFGLAKAARAREKMQDTCGTPWYSAPEILLERPYGPGVDVWSLGVGMYTLLKGSLPFDNSDEDELAELICDADFDLDSEEWDAVSPEARDLLKGMLEPNPSHRLTAAEALEHVWFTGDGNSHSRNLHHVHGRLESLRTITRQLPVRKFHPGDWLVREGESNHGEVFMIKSGECETLQLVDGEYEKVGVRRAGNFIGISRIPFRSRVQMQSSEDQDKSTDHLQRSVRAVTEVQAIVLNQRDMEWAVDDDYRRQDEFQKAIKKRRREIRRQGKMTPAPALSPPDADNNINTPVCAATTAV